MSLDKKRERTLLPRRRFACGLLLGTTLAIIAGLCYLIYNYVDDRSDFITTYYSGLSYEQKAVPRLVKDVMLNVKRDNDVSGGIPENVVYYVASQIERRYAKGEISARWRPGTFVTSHLLKRVLNETQILALNCHFLPSHQRIGSAELEKFYFDKDMIEMTIDCDYSPKSNPNNCYEMEARLVQKMKQQL